MKALVGALALLFLVPPAVAAAAGEEQPVAVAAARTAVVEAGRSRGAGFAVDEDRLLTAAHVVTGHDTVTVVAIVVIIIGAGYLIIKRRARAS